MLQHCTDYCATQQAGVADLRSDVCLGTLELPLGPLVDCCTFRGRQEYRRWFPLTAPDEETDLLGGQHSADASYTEERTCSTRRSVIQLAVQWTPTKVEGEAVEATRAYMCVRLGGIEASLVDSTRAQELLHLTIGKTDVGWAEVRSGMLHTYKHTDRTPGSLRCPLHCAITAHRIAQVRAYRHRIL
jgi:hypothetical protein